MKWQIHFIVATKTAILETLSSILQFHLCKMNFVLEVLEKQTKKACQHGKYGTIRKLPSTSLKYVKF